jgi:hypothetical protein
MGADESPSGLQIDACQLDKLNLLEFFDFQFSIFDFYFILKKKRSI